MTQAEIKNLVTQIFSSKLNDTQLKEYIDYQLLRKERYSGERGILIFFNSIAIKIAKEKIKIQTKEYIDYDVLRKIADSTNSKFKEYKTFEILKLAVVVLNKKNSKDFIKMFQEVFGSDENANKYLNTFIKSTNKATQTAQKVSSPVQSTTPVQTKSTQTAQKVSSPVQSTPVQTKSTQTAQKVSSPVQSTPVKKLFTPNNIAGLIQEQTKIGEFYTKDNRTIKLNKIEFDKMSLNEFIKEFNALKTISDQLFDIKEKIKLFSFFDVPVMLIKSNKHEYIYAVKTRAGKKYRIYIAPKRAKYRTKLSWKDI